MKVIIAGGRDFTDYNLLKEKMNFILRNLEEIEIVCGMADGADLLGKRYAEEKGFPVKEMPAKWNDVNVPNAVVKTNKFGKLYNVKAGIERNEEMAKYADACVCFWDGKSSGTKNMIDNAKKYGLKLRVIHY